MIWLEQHCMINSDNGKKANTGWWSSGDWLKETIVLRCLFLMLLLSSCARTETEYVVTPPAPIPESLLIECPIPEIPEGFTWGNSLELNERLLTALNNCNNDKAAIQKIEQSRAVIAPFISGQ